VVPFGRDELDYQPYYCEENVFRLLGHPELAAWQAWAVLVSSRTQDAVLMRQRAGRPVDGLVHWDYHVFALLLDPGEGALVLDIDTQLPFPCPFSRYIEDTFPVGSPSVESARFRMIAAAEYLSSFSSDRSHMRRDDGSWIWPPPPWPAPGSAEGRPSNLLRWIDVRRRSPGRLFDLRRLSALVSRRERVSIRRMG